MNSGQELLVQSFDKILPLDQVEKDQLIDLFEPLTYKRNDFLLQEGQISRNEFLVVSGSLRQYIVDSKGKEQVLSLCINGWWCGDLRSFLNRTPTMYNIQSIENSEVFAINQTNWERLFRTPKMDRRGRIMLQYALIAKNDRIVRTKSLTAKERYNLFLKSYPEIHNRIPLKYIASYLGITPEFLSELRKSSLSAIS